MILSVTVIVSRVILSTTLSSVVYIRRPTVVAVAFRLPQNGLLAGTARAGPAHIYGRALSSYLPPARDEDTSPAPPANRSERSASRAAPTCANADTHAQGRANTHTAAAVRILSATAANHRSQVALAPLRQYCQPQRSPVNRPVGRGPNRSERTHNNNIVELNVLFPLSPFIIERKSQGNNSIIRPILILYFIFIVKTKIRNDLVMNS